MKIVKGVAVYTGVIIGMLLIVGILLFSAMFIFPGFGVFGYRVINERDSAGGVGLFSTQNLKAENTVFVDIDAGGFDVVIKQHPDNTQGITLKKMNNVFGLYKYDAMFSNKIVFSQPKAGNGQGSGQTGFSNQLTIKVPQREGFVDFRDSSITLSLPAKLAGVTVKYEVNVTSTTGDVIIDGGYTENRDGLKITGLEVSTTKGNLNVSKIAMEDTERTAIIFDKLNLATAGGNFDLRGFNQITSKAGINLESEKGNFYFKKLIGSTNIQGSDILIEADEIDCQGGGFTFNASYGIFHVKKIINNKAKDGQIISIITNYVDVALEEVLGEASIKTIYGNISIDKVKSGQVYNKEEIQPSNLSLQSEHGSITVGAGDTGYAGALVDKIKQPSISAINEFGDIYVNKFLGKLYMENKNGNIEANFNYADFNAMAAAEKSELSKNFVEAVNYQGNIVLKDVITSALVTVNGGTADVTFKEMLFIQGANINYSKHILTANGGNINVAAPNTQAFHFVGIGNGNIKGSVGTENMNKTAGKDILSTTVVYDPAVTPPTGNNVRLTANANGGTIKFETRY